MGFSCTDEAGSLRFFRIFQVWRQGGAGYANQGKQDGQRFPDGRARHRGRGVFFCFSRPGRDIVTGEWTEEAGDVKWYLYLLKTGEILEDANAIFKAVQCLPDTPRICRQEQQELVEIRKTLDKHLNKTYLRKVQAPVGVKPVLRAWMELNG